MFVECNVFFISFRRHETCITVVDVGFDRNGIQRIRYIPDMSRRRVTLQVIATVRRELTQPELYSPGSTGRLFLGDDFRYTTAKSFTFELPGVDNSSPVKLRTSFGAKILGGTATLVFTRNGQTLPSSNTDNIGAGSSSSYDFVRMKLCPVIRSFVPLPARRWSPIDFYCRSGNNILR